ncbi:hypothetical protein KJZ61_04310 [Candidatus Dependentiae bacterium]|nr:hypothetical protein [Candidatus Dependentiae bacterium]
MIPMPRAIASHTRYLLAILIITTPYQLHTNHSVKPTFSHHFLQTCFATHLINAHNQPSMPPKPTQQTIALSREKIHRIISLSALLYASSAIAWHAKTIYLSNSPKNNLLPSALNSYLPKTLVTLYKHHQLLGICLKVTLETLIFKCIAHCLVACAYSSLFDELRNILKHVIPGIRLGRHTNSARLKPCF